MSDVMSMPFPFLFGEWFIVVLRLAHDQFVFVVVVVFVFVFVFVSFRFSAFSGNAETWHTTSSLEGTRPNLEEGRLI